MSGADRLLTTEEVADFLGVDPATVHRWRSLGLGPPVAQLGGRTIRYRPEDVKAWIDAHVRQPARGDAT